MTGKMKSCVTGLLFGLVGCHGPVAVQVKPVTCMEKGVLYILDADAVLRNGILEVM